VIVTDTAANGATAGPVAGLVDANGVQLAYESFGHPADPTILLVMGLGTQLLAWPEALCADLAAAGHHVIRFDNRDVGLSTKLDHPAPSLGQIVTGRGRAYSIADMADDAFGLLAALGIDAAHVVGASMGGFIAQTMAIRQPTRVLSLTLVMTSTGSKRVGRPSPAAMRQLATLPVARSRDEAIAAALRVSGVIGSPAYRDADRVRDIAARSYDRSYHPAGRARHLAAVIAQPDRTRALRSVRIPTTVVHGLEDPLVSASGGIALARAIPGATFVGHHGMGHDLPMALLGGFTEDILGTVARAG
jgi:pimeloyl-ACP methyl ester carboxylesterase